MNVDEMYRKIRGYDMCDTITFRSNIGASTLIVYKGGYVIVPDYIRNEIMKKLSSPMELQDTEDRYVIDKFVNTDKNLYLMVKYKSL